MKQIVLLLVVLVVVCSTLIPDNWQSQIDKANAFYGENDDGDFAENGYPEGLYLPMIGNGYFSHAKGVRSDTYFVSGVYNGETTSPSHRARIPATFALTVDNSQTTGVLLDIEQGVYRRRGIVNGLSYELRWYAHRSLKNIYVAEFEVLKSADSDVEISFSNNRGEDSEDINFTLHSVNSELNTELNCGKTTIPETPEGPTPSVCILNTIVPKSIVVKKGEDGHQWTFINSIFTSLDDLRLQSVEEVSDGATKAFLQAHDLRRCPVHAAAPNQLFQSHVDSWAKVWQNGIEVTGRFDVAAAANASQFAIYSSVRDDWPYGLAPGGLTNYYNGHGFWDTETWMYPPLLLIQPSIARSLMQYRFDRLPGAYRKAKSYDPPFAGAMFPWESAFSGVETCPLFADTGLREQHISADISIGAYQYYLVTGDLGWLKEVGYPILKGVADFWVSKITIDPTDGSAHIPDVIPPDEYVDHVEDSVYTNYAASEALLSTVKASQALKIDTDPQVQKDNDLYSSLASRLVILFDNTTGTHPEYAGYAGQVVKQADVVLLHYPLGMSMSHETVKANLDYYSPRTDLHGPAMTWGMHAIGYKDLGELPLAATYFNDSFHDNMHGPNLL